MKTHTKLRAFEVRSVFDRVDNVCHLGLSSNPHMNSPNFWNAIKDNKKLNNREVRRDILEVKCPVDFQSHI